MQIWTDEYTRPVRRQAKYFAMYHGMENQLSLLEVTVIEHCQQCDRLYLFGLKYTLVEFATSETVLSHIFYKNDTR